MAANHSVSLPGKAPFLFLASVLQTCHLAALAPGMLGAGDAFGVETPLLRLPVPIPTHTSTQPSRTNWAAGSTVEHFQHNHPSNPRLNNSSRVLLQLDSVAVGAFLSPRFVRPELLVLEKHPIQCEADPMK